jgi:hypothetical protein
VINELKQLHIPKGALIFHSDATSMYTNFDTTLGVSPIRNFITLYKDILPINFPAYMFLHILTIVIEK